MAFGNQEDELKMKLRYLAVVLPLLLGPATFAHAEVNVSIGINMPAYPRLVLIPGYPVYYDPYVDANYFFYDGMYWVYQGDNWYASSWYNGPWQLVDPYSVPVFLLRVPVRYYRRPPPYFHGWRADAPPHWGAHWGRDWEERHHDWNHWDRHAVPHAAPRPDYQRQFSGERYPRTQQEQHSIRSEHYHYQPREGGARQHFEQRESHNNPQAPFTQPQQMEQRERGRPEQHDRGNDSRDEGHGHDRR
jgi:hypothetical protein